MYLDVTARPTRIARARIARSCPGAGWPTPKLPTKNLPTKIACLQLSGKFPVDMRIPPLSIEDSA